MLVPLSIMGLWKKLIVDECASHVTLFVQALSLELAGVTLRHSLRSLLLKRQIISVLFVWGFSFHSSIFHLY